jgi:hypothetical protein
MELSVSVEYFFNVLSYYRLWNLFKAEQRLIPVYWCGMFSLCCMLLIKT